MTSGGNDFDLPLAAGVFAIDAVHEVVVERYVVETLVVELVLIGSLGEATSTRHVTVQCRRGGVTGSARSRSRCRQLDLRLPRSFDALYIDTARHASFMRHFLNMRTARAHTHTHTHLSGTGSTG